MPEYDIIVAGHLCLDITPSIPPGDATSIGQIIVPGTLVNVGPAVVSTGGPVSNTGIAMLKLGMKPLCMAKVGDDMFGHLVLDAMNAHGCADGIACVDGEETSYTIVIAPPGIDRVFLHNPGANNTFCFDDVRFDLVERCGFFHLGYPPLMNRLFENEGEQLTAIFKEAKRRGATTSLDMSLPDPNTSSGRAPWEKILRQTLPYIDLFVPSVEEVLYFFNRPQFDAGRTECKRSGADPIDIIKPSQVHDLGNRLIEFGAGVVLLKCGHRGIYLRSADAGRLDRFGKVTVSSAGEWAGRELWKNAVHVDPVVSATGSGDCAIAGFLTAFCRGMSPEQSLAFAAAVGGQNVTTLDATSGIRSYEETIASLKSLRFKKLGLKDTTWNYDTTTEYWKGPGDRRS